MSTATLILYATDMFAVHSRNCVSSQQTAERNKFMEITYSLAGDYLLPNIIFKEPPEMVAPLGRYGRMHKAFLQEHRLMLYNQLLLTERLYPLCHEIDETAANRLETIPDREAAHEIILAELVYS